MWIDSYSKYFFIYSAPPLPSRSHISSRINSRAVSPATSQRSRRSTRNNRYVPQDPTDDEDSDDELETAEDLHRPRSRREILANRAARRGGRKMSTQSNFEMDIDPIESDTAAAATSTSRNRFSHRRGDTRRGGSVARSLHEYPITRTLSPDRDIPFNGLKKNHPTGGARSDSLTSTSEMDSDKYPHNKKLEQEGILKTGQSSTRLQPIPTKSLTNSEEKDKGETSAPIEITISPKTQTSTAKWECEHCTFVNESDARICAICCKTSTRVLETLPPSPPEESTELEQTTSEQPQISSTDHQNSSTLNVKEGRKDRKITFCTGSKKPLKLVK